MASSFPNGMLGQIISKAIGKIGLRIMILLISGVGLIFLFSSMVNKDAPNDAPSVITDKDDYSPGETAYITATGFEPGETIEFLILHIGGKPNTGNGHTPWQVKDGSVEDLDGKEDGNIETTWYVDPDDSLNSRFELTANGQSSGFDASTIFLDDVAVPTSVTSTYDPISKELIVNVEWVWLDNTEKAVSFGIFADLNGDNIKPDQNSLPGTYTSGGNLTTSEAQEEFLGQIFGSSIQGTTIVDANCGNGLTIADNTDTGIGQLSVNAGIAASQAGMTLTTPHALLPYGLRPVNDVATGTTTDGNSNPTGCFSVKYTNVQSLPTSICIIMYDIHTDGGTTLPSGSNQNSIDDTTNGCGKHGVVTAGPCLNEDNSVDDGFDPDGGGGSGKITVACGEPGSTTTPCVPSSSVIGVTKITN